MDRLEKKMRYLRFSFLHNVLDFLVNIYFSFPKFVRIVYHGLVHHKKSHEFTPIYPSMLTEIISLSRTSDFSLDPPPDIKGHLDRSCDAISKSIYFP